MKNIELLRKFIIEAIEEEIHEEIEESEHPQQYGAPKGSERDKQLTRAQKLYRQGDIQGAVAIRQNMDEK